MAALILVALCFLMSLQIAQQGLWMLQLEWGASLLQDRNCWIPFWTDSSFHVKVHKQFCPSTRRSVKVVDVKTLVTFIAFTNI